MEGKSWFIALLLTLIFTGLSANHFGRDYDGEEAPATAIKWNPSASKIFFKGKRAEQQRPHTADTKRIPLSPNISSCHHSLSEGGRRIHCCPRTPYSDEQRALEFELPNSTSPVRHRRPAHLLSEDYVSKYNKAVAAMKLLPPDHPHNFFRQADVHCAYCTGAYDQCQSITPLAIHHSWFFFPWHRMFLYFHERILGKLIGDDSFALPYWNWDSPEGMTIPAVYLNGSLYDKRRDTSHLPPKVVDLDYNGVDSGINQDEQIASNLAMMYRQMISGARKYQLFMGCKLKWGNSGVCDSSGTIELTPHNTLHKWMGSKTAPEEKNMGAYHTAARDPIFYSHHANLDRLWTLWKDLHEGETEFHDPAWLDSSFYFYDENLRLVRVKVRHFLDVDKLMYRYEDAHLPWLHARPQPSVPPKIAREILRRRNHDVLDNNADESVLRLLPGETSVTLDTSIRIKVHRPMKRVSEEEVLVVYGIDVKKDVYVKFDVYVNVVDVAVAGPQSREFAGSFVRAKHGAAPATEKKKEEAIRGVKSCLKLGISELLEEIEADGDDFIWVTLVPRGGTGANVAVDGVRIEHMQ